MSVKSIQRIQDSVHGLMEFRGMETLVIELLRTPELQRLRKIRQLGLAHLVFPGAEHSRLVHSLGVSHLAIRWGRHLKEVSTDKFIPALCPDESTIRDLAIAALCHDLGHGPMSHAFEREIIGKDFDRELWYSSLEIEFGKEFLNEKKWHEIVGFALLGWKGGQLHRLLEQQETGSSERIQKLLLGQYYLPYLPKILSSDIDVDRADFIIRDTHQTGVAYGRYDLNWLISTSTFGIEKDEDKENWVIGFDARKSIRVIEQFLIARRAMYETVYHHKTVRCAEGMMRQFLSRLRQVIKDDTKIEVADFVQPILKIIRGIAIEPNEILKLDDFAIWVLIDSISQSSVKDETVRDLAERIRARDLFKQVPVSTHQINRFNRTEGAKEKIYEVIKPYCRGDSRYYVIEDVVEFEMLSTDPKEKVCLINNNGSVQYCDDNPSFEMYKNKKVEELRIYTIREAVEVVAKLIVKNQ